MPKTSILSIMPIMRLLIFLRACPHWQKIVSKLANLAKKNNKTLKIIRFVRKTQGNTQRQVKTKLVSETVRMSKPVVVVVLWRPTPFCERS